MSRNSLPLALLVAFGLTLLVPRAYGDNLNPRYSDGCRDCHGSFTDGVSPKGTVVAGNNKHEMHRASSFMATDCALCHTGNPNNVEVWLGTSTGTMNSPGVGCTGCHGRDYKGSIGNSAVGLRLHHEVNGISCGPCHSDDPVPLPENVSPIYYGTSDTNADDACNAGPAFLENWSIGDTLGLDNDGDNVYDVADSDVPTWFRDADGDGFGDTNVTVEGCTPPAGFVDNDDDCDDGNVLVSPDAAEACDGRDNDCDGVVPADEIDGDGDGFLGCDDCDDADDEVFPGRPELCDEKDNDCDGQVDQLVPLWYRDSDGDGFGDADSTQNACVQPAGFVFDATDCDDTDPAVFPGAAELCNGVDDDCNGALGPAETDLDGDGFSECDGDCGPLDPDVFPGAPELTDGIDNDCDGQLSTAEQDDDNDGVFNADDQCPGVDDRIDSDSDGSPDECDNCPDTSVPSQADFDEDGFGNFCDNCAITANPDQRDNDNDGVGNACDNCPDRANRNQRDGDEDRVGDLCDNCPQVANADQADADQDGIGDACDDDDAPPSVDDPDPPVMLSPFDELLAACGIGTLPALALTMLGLVGARTRRRKA